MVSKYLLRMKTFKKDRKKTLRRLSPWLASPNRVDSRTDTIAAGQVRLSADFEHLKNALLKEQLKEAPEGAIQTWLRWAAEEASSLAWATPYPLLLLPELLEEKSRKARLQAERQHRMRTRSQTVLAV